MLPLKLLVALWKCTFHLLYIGTTHWSEIQTEHYWWTEACKTLIGYETDARLSTAVHVSTLLLPHIRNPACYFGILILFNLFNASSLILKKEEATHDSLPWLIRRIALPC